MTIRGDQTWLHFITFTHRLIFMNYVLIFLLLNVGCSQVELKPFTEDVKNIFKTNIVTENEIIIAFKQVLEISAIKSIDLLSAENTFLTDNNVTIPFPKEAQKVEQSLRKIGFNSVCDDFNQSMNKSAELAVKEAIPIFIEAIKNITFSETKKLLNGSDTAITDFLKTKTSTALISKFNPIISTQLEDNKTTKQWNKLINKYNKLPLVKPVQADLSYHVTQKAVDAIFYYIAKEETEIRKDPAARTTDLIKKVFSQID